MYVIHVALSKIQCTFSLLNYLHFCDSECCFCVQCIYTKFPISQLPVAGSEYEEEKAQFDDQT